MKSTKSVVEPPESHRHEGGPFEGTSRNYVSIVLVIR